MPLAALLRASPTLKWPDRWTGSIYSILSRRGSHPSVSALRFCLSDFVCTLALSLTSHFVFGTVFPASACVRLSEHSGSNICVFCGPPPTSSLAQTPRHAVFELYSASSCVRLHAHSRSFCVFVLFNSFTSFVSRTPSRAKVLCAVCFLVSSGT